MIISGIVAMSRNNIIGINNKLPWHLPADLKNFKKITLNKPVIMGRNTYESIGKPLPNRANIVITSQKIDGVELFDSIEDAIEAYKNCEEVVIIGGEKLFKSSLHLINKMYITMIDEEFEGDTYFPTLNMNEWKIIKEESFEPDEKNKYKFKFVELVKK